MKPLIHVLMLAILLAGCSSSNEDPKEAREEVVDAMHQPLEKAKDVEKQIFDSAEQQRKQADDL